MTERELMIECIPQITEMALEIQKMTPEQYLKYKMSYLAEVKTSCPAALGFIKKIYDIIEWSMFGEIIKDQKEGSGKCQANMDLKVWMRKAVLTIRSLKACIFQSWTPWMCQKGLWVKRKRW